MALTAGMSAQTDVTSTYITNAGFASTDGWTQYVSSQYKDIGNGLIGTYKIRSNQSAATVDDTHLATEYCFGFECRWAGNFSSYNQTTSSLPAGVYTLTYDVENVNAKTTKSTYSNLFNVKVGETTYADASTEWMNGKSSWTTHTVSFTLNEAAPATISLGYGTGGNNYSDTNTPCLYVSHLKLTYQSLLAVAQTLWQEAKDEAETAYNNDEYTNITGVEWRNLKAEIEKAEPTTKEGYEEATKALKDATDTFIAAKPGYDALDAIGVYVDENYDNDLPYVSAAKNKAFTDLVNTIGPENVDNAAQAQEAADRLTNALRAYVESNAMAEGVEGAVDKTDLIVNHADPKNNDGWTWTGNKNDPRNDESWTDADGTNNHSYFDGGNWGANSWTTTMEQSIALPAGKYYLTAKERASVDLTTYRMEVSTGDAPGKYVNMQHIGTTITSVFGRGWNDASLEFTTDGSAPVVIKVTATASSSQQWFSISDFRLVQLEFYYGQALKNAIKAAQSTLDDEKFEIIVGEERTALQDAITAAQAVLDGGTTLTESQVEAEVGKLNTAMNGFTQVLPSYQKLVDTAKDIMTQTSSGLPYASEETTTAYVTAFQNAVTVTNIANAADAEAKAEALYPVARAYFESNAKAEGVEGAEDVTSVIANPDASDGNNGWTFDGKMNNPASNQPWTDADGSNTHTYFDGGNWGAKSWTTTMEQTIALPAGKYYLTVKERGATNMTNYKMMIDGTETSVDLLHNSSVGGVFGNGWNDRSLEFETEGGDVTIKVTASTETQYEWFSISDFRLVRLELKEELATAEDYLALEAAISDAEDNLGSDRGEYAPYNNIDKLQAIAAAKALNKEAGNPKADITDLIEAISTGWTTNTEEVNAIFDGQFATTSANTTTGDISLPGWTKVQGIRLLVKDTTENPGLEYTDGKAAVFSWGGTTLTYGEQAGYTLPLNQGETYELKLKVSGWRDGDMPNVVKVNLDGQEKTVDAAALGAKAINTADSNPFVTLSFRLKASAEGDSKLTIYANHHFTIADLSLMLAGPAELDEAEDNSAVEAEENVTVKVKRTIKQGYNTMVLPFDLTAEQVAAAFGEGAEVYTFSDKADGEDVVISFQKAEAISANVPVLVKATVASTEQTFEGVNLVAPAAEPKAEGAALDFIGTYAPITVAAGDYFVNSGTLYKSNGSTSLKAFRAYLKLKAGTDPNAVKLRIGSDTTTAIDAVNAGAQTVDGAVYNLSGQRVSQPTKGIYIINGKKVMMK